MNKERKYVIDEASIINFFGIANYINSKKIESDNIILIVNNANYDFDSFSYEVRDGDKSYIVDLSLYRNAIRHYGCQCDKFKKNRKCEHIAGVFSKRFEVTNKNPNLTVDDYYSGLIKKLTNTNESLFIDLDITFDFNTNDYTLVKLKIGNDKKYSINSKLSSFFNYFNLGKGTLEIGRYFTYEPLVHKFNDADVTIISYLESLYQNNSRSILLNQNQLLFLLKLMGKKAYYIDGYKNKFYGYVEGYPYQLNLSLINEKYNFKFDIMKTNFLNNKNSIALENNKLYLLNEKMSVFITELMENNIEEINLEKNEAVTFSKTVSPMLKENYIIEESLVDEFQVSTPTVKLFFDFKSSIECKIKFQYKTIEVNYYDKEGAFRNFDFEKLVLSKLTSYGFYDNKNKYLLDEINKIVDFIDLGIFELKNTYEIYTSENFENANIYKASSIKSQFSIGKDNIMNYKFELDGISPDELKKVFNSMENKVKYFKLKSGKILNTDDSAIKELKTICDNLSIDEYSDLGVIPKYRALYLDSVKDYSIVSTNNTFNAFINNFNKYKDLDININNVDKNILRDYQLTGIKWMYNIYKSGFSGILADEMGLGKSIQTIMFIKNIIKEKPDAKILIVAPTSLIYNWENEFNMFGSGLFFSVIANNKEERIKKLENNSNIFITTYGLLRQDQDIYSNIEFELIIIDEAQNIKNPKAGISMALKTLKSNSKMALTGTPIENSVIEVWSVFDFLMPGYLNSLSVFQSKYNIKDVDNDTKEKLNDLTRMIAPFILRRKKKDVLFDLPDKFENEIYLDLLPEQKKYYAMQVKKSKEEYENLVEEEGFLKARFKILQLLTKLRQLCIDPKIVFENFEDESVKMVEIINLLQQYTQNGHKVLVFSSFRTALNILKEKLDENMISNYTINGSVSSKVRNDLVNSFNKDNTNVFLITLKAGGTGLNLTSADVVIHLDLWWNPQAENQATDRAHRIGQEKKVEVVKLICKGTIEEKILDLQNKKKILNDTLIENEDVSEVLFNKLSEQDIKDLFKLAD